jgi:hypothetical protein
MKKAPKGAFSVLNFPKIFGPSIAEKDESRSSAALKATAQLRAEKYGYGSLATNKNICI